MELKNNNRNFPNRLLERGLVHLALTCFAGFLFANIWIQFVSNPTVTSLENPAFPVADVPFPGVALCNANKISRRRARSLVDYIVNATGEDREDVSKYVKFLGFLYDADYDVRYNEEFERFQEILDNLHLTIHRVMNDLTVPCEELLHSCRWQGVAVNCSSMFTLRLTFDGFCCTFNYVKNTSYWWRRHHIMEDLTPQSGSHGMKSGLSVAIHNDPEDYSFTSLETIGVLVFIPTDYPDKASGDLIESIAEIGSENFLEVIPTTVSAVRDVMSHNVDKRDCLFEVEQRTQFGVYSQSDCFVDCRVKSMLTLCECIPFTIPFSTGENVCTLSDLPCLNKYQTKWRSLNPYNLDEKIQIKEREEFSCPKICYPSCEATLYELSSSSVRLFNQMNHTHVHVYYGSRFHNLFQQDVVHYWFDILSNIGGLFGLVLGISILSIVEGIIYCGKYVAERW